MRGSRGVAAGQRRGSDGEVAPYGARMRATVAAPLAFAALVLLLLAGVYALAFGVPAVSTADQRAIPEGLAGPGVAQAETATARLLDTISVGSLVLAAAGLVAVALARRRYRQAVAAAAVMAGANLTTQILKPALGRLDPLGGDAERLSEGIFPSGHATVAMSLALALVIVVPAPLRPVAAVIGVGYAGAVGVGLVLLGWHFPSDVVGGFLVAALWAAAAVAWLRQPERSQAVTMAPAPRVRAGLRVALAVAVVMALAVAVAIGMRVNDLGEVAEYGRLRTAFIGGAAVIAALALALPPSVAALMLRGRVDEARATA